MTPEEILEKLVDLRNGEECYAKWEVEERWHSLAHYAYMWLEEDKNHCKVFRPQRKPHRWIPREIDGEPRQICYWCEEIKEDK